MSVWIEVVNVHDWDDDHEVGGQDLPCTYTATVHGGTVNTVIDMMNANYGTFSKTEAFNIEAISDIQVQFVTFQGASVGQKFEWHHSFIVQTLISRAEAKIFNLIERRARLALMAVIDPKPVYARCHWWDHVHPDPALLKLFDKNGVEVKIGDACRFRISETGREGTGWIAELSANAICPIVVRPDTTIGHSGLGAKPSEIEIVPEA